MQQGSVPSAGWRLIGPRYAGATHHTSSLVECKKFVPLTDQETARLTVPGVATAQQPNHPTAFAFDPVQELLWTGNEAVSLGVEGVILRCWLLMFAS